jgi:glycosyltransferase involved in cell wall biosynthesis
MSALKSYTGVSIVIPAYNEEGRLPRTLSALESFCTSEATDVEVIVVDDGSTDGTVDLIRSQAVARPWLSVLECPHRGKGAAVRAGVLTASKDRILLCDADLSMPIEHSHRLLQALEDGYHLAIGSRALAHSHVYHDPVQRQIMSRAFNLLVRAMVLRGVQDTQCGFKAFRREVALDLFSRQRLEGFSFDVEILYLARKRGYFIKEVPIDWYCDRNSRVRALRDSLAMIGDLFRIRLNTILGEYQSPAYAALGEQAHLADVPLLPAEPLAVLVEPVVATAPPTQ